MAHLDAVNHHVDVVLLGFLELRQVVVLKHLATHTKAHIALGLQVGKHVGVFAFAVTCQRRQQHELGVFGQGHHRVHHLRHALRLQRQVVVGAVRGAGTGKQQAQVVVNFGHRAYGGAGVVAGGFLLNADGGRQALDQVDIGLVQTAQELTGVGRQTFHVAALALGVQGVKRQARLARARQAGDHHQLVARNVEVDVFEVVRARAANADVSHGGGAVHGLAQVGAVGGCVHR